MDGPRPRKLFSTTFGYKTCGSPEISVGAPRIDISEAIFEKTFFRFIFLDFYCNLPRKAENLTFLLRNAETGFSKKWPKIVIRGPPTEISGDPVLIDRKFFQNDFGVGGPPISDFWPFFRFPIFEISTNSEKGCFLCCRFFWIGNKNNSVVFSGRPNFLPKKTCECHHCPI